MPFKSEKQRRFMWMKHPQIARRWAHEQKGSKGPVHQIKKVNNSGQKGELRRIYKMPHNNKKKKKRSQRSERLGNAAARRTYKIEKKKKSSGRMSGMGGY